MASKAEALLGPRLAAGGRAHFGEVFGDHGGPAGSECGEANETNESREKLFAPTNPKSLNPGKGNEGTASGHWTLHKSWPGAL